MKFSIIIPCYNAAFIIEKCLDSIAAQTYHDFEVILVDDCSSDNTIQILKDYQKKSDINIHIQNLPQNSGPGKARNKGLEYAKGEYITFVDCDDYVEKDFLKKVAEIIEKKSFDCVLIDYYRVYKEEKKSCHTILKQEDLYIKEVFALSSGSTWGKFYKREILEQNHISYPSVMRGEDLAFNKQALAHCQNFYYLNEPLYNYVINPNSIMNNKKTIDIEKYEIVFDCIKKNIPKEYSEELEFIYIKNIFYPMMKEAVILRKNRKTLKNTIIQLQQKYPHWIQNKYLKYIPFYMKILLRAISVHAFFVLRWIFARK